jgi:hypothetical protein
MDALSVIDDHWFLTADGTEVDPGVNEVTAVEVFQSINVHGSVEVSLHDGLCL